jgi:molybdopterin-guanine dinucleotide biosynthesis protein A
MSSATAAVDAAAVDAAAVDALVPYDALILAGGAARRLGGQDKTGLLVGGQTLLDRVIAAVSDAVQVIVVGPVRPVQGSVRWVREEPPGGGPVAGIAAGLAEVTAPVVAVLAGDLPFLSPSAIAAMRAAVTPAVAGTVTPPVAGTVTPPVAGTAAGALLVDAGDRDQLLAGCWRTAALRGAVATLATPVDASVRRTVASLPVARVRLPVDPASPPPWWDCDTFDDVEQARSWA